MNALRFSEQSEQTGKDIEAALGAGEKYIRLYHAHRDNRHELVAAAHIQMQRLAAELSPEDYDQVVEHVYSLYNKLQGNKDRAN